MNRLIFIGHVFFFAADDAFEIRVLWFYFIAAH